MVGVPRRDSAQVAQLRIGHGRTVAVTERVHDGAALEEREIRTQYLASGEVAKISRVRVGKADSPVIRWMRYDTLGRMVLNVEPNTTKHFNPDPAADASAMKAWRYAYNDAGDLVGTSDARGCGTNYHYDSAGRLLAEDYSPCLAHHPLYSPPVFTPGEESGLEVLNRYDYAPGDKTAITAAEPDCVINDTLYAGRLAEVWDRGARTVSVYDGRGRITCAARKMGKPGKPSDTLADRYAPRWYVQTAAFDAADRPVLESTGAKVAELMGGDDKSRIATTYSARGSVKHVGGSYGTLVASVVHDADGLTTGIVYGDAASTTTAFDYDLKRRLRSVQTYRGPPSVWTSGAISPATTGASTLQLVLEDLEYTYDGADNPIEIRDWRKPAEWSPGAQPVTRKIEYDDLYRVTKVGYQYSAGDDTWVSPFHAENTGTGGAATDPRMAYPSPHVAFDKRVLWQSFSYDWLGNTTKTDDDAKGFYDRSLGTITNGTSEAGPYQLKGASNLGSGTRAGALTAKYDDAGYLVSMAVRRDGPCLPTTPTAAKCGQRFVYEWDEAGRLQRARRWDLAATAVGSASDPEPSSAAAVELRYQYNGGDQRTLKTAIDLATGEERHTVYVSPSLELRRAMFAGGEYARAAYSEVPYLFANGVRVARVAYEDADVPSIAVLSKPRLHVFFELGDHLGSASTVLDKDNSELVEKATYLAAGSTDADYRSIRWKASRCDQRFTGKEDDVEVGLQYFGFRYLNASMGRWASADPAAIQILAADINGYAYVRGRLLASTDPNGLREVDGSEETDPGIVREARGEGAFFAMGGAIVLLHGGEPAASTSSYISPRTGIPGPALASGRLSDAEFVFSTAALAFGATAFGKIALPVVRQLLRPRASGAVVSKPALAKGAAVKAAAPNADAAPPVAKGALPKAAAPEAAVAPKAASAPAGTQKLDLKLKYKEGWSTSQQAAALEKVKKLDAAAKEGRLIKSDVKRDATAASTKWKQAGNTKGPNDDIDHVIDMQLNGVDDISNMSPLDKSVNRSLGAQIMHKIKPVPVGTRIDSVSIE